MKEDIEGLKKRYEAYLNVLNKYFGDYRYVLKYKWFYKGALTALDAVRKGKRGSPRGSRT